MRQFYIGLMSGTSLDGVDGVLVEFDVAGPTGLAVLGHAHEPFAHRLRDDLLALNVAGTDELHRAAIAANALAEVYAGVVGSLLSQTGIPSHHVRAIGAHGQTVRHRPGEFDGVGYTLQLNSPALLVERTGIPVVADFRSRDVAAGGQGAPLVPAFHRAVFGRPGEPLAVLNIGGFSNLTAVDSDGSIIGFDCGPGNVLLDHWCATHLGEPFDKSGQWASTGGIIKPLLDAMLDDVFFALPAPKSTGRDRFNPGWLEAQVHQLPSPPGFRPEDVQYTLTELTARTSADQVRRHAVNARELLVCGGGALNQHLLQRLSVSLPGVRVVMTNARGLPCTQVEACAFAWLARAHLESRPASVSQVTGARGTRILGALYPASRTERA
jgi:anhydro-N-acetylmuramic acid kinase